MSQTKSSNGAGQPVTIFVVDDEQMLLDLAEAILKPLGYKVRTFSDPWTALQEYRTAPPTLVVTDYAMGGMNGLDLVRECKRLNPKQKMILLSGTVDEAIFEGLPHKPDRFMVKPYPVHEFIEIIRSLIAS